MVSCNVFWLLDLNILWSLVDPSHLELVQYSKHEIMKKIANMEMEYSQLITWNTHMILPTDASSQWGHNIKIVDEPRKITGSKMKSFLADMFGFAINGEFNAVSNYLKTMEASN